MSPPIQDTHTPRPPPTPNTNRPLTQRKPPMSRNQHATKHIHDLHHKPQEPLSTLLHGQQHRFNIVFEEYARNRALADDVRLLGDGVLVCENRRSVVGGVNGVDGGNDREEVLEFVEVVRCGGYGTVEGVDEGGVEGAEGEFGDYVREVECFERS